VKLLTDRQTPGSNVFIVVVYSWYYVCDRRTRFRWDCRTVSRYVRVIKCQHTNCQGM